MTNGEEQFKNQLQDRLNTKDFPFEESEWNKMSALLDNRERRRRFVYFMYAGLFIGALLISGLFLFNETDSPAIAEQKNNALTKTEKIQSAPVQDSPETQKNAIKKSTAPPTQPGKVLTTTPAVKNHNPAAATQAAPVKQQLATDAPNNAPTATRNVHAPETVKEPITQKTPDIAQIAAPAVVASSQNDPKTIQNEVTSDQKEISDQSPETIATDDSKKEPPVAEEQKIVPIAVAVPISNLAPTKIVEPKTTPIENNNEAKTPVEASPVAVAASETTAPAETVVNAETPIVEATPIATLAAIKPDTDYVKAKRPDINFEAGGTMMFGWKDESGRDAAGINPVLGVNYLLPIGKEFKIGMGIQYTSVGHLRNSTYTATVTKLDFGSYTRYTVFTPNVIHYLNVPLRLGYVLDKNSMAGAGVNLGYLLTVNSQVEKYEQDLNGTYNYETYKEKGYTQAFNDFQAQLTFFYERRIWQHLRINAELMYGLTDVKNGNAIQSTMKERNSGIKLSIIYRIFDK